MINIERTECPAILKTGIAPSSAGEKETRDAISFYADQANHNQKYQKMGRSGTKRTKTGYTVYADKAVRSMLLEMFHGKCAYCESKITAIYNGDIEHFRPKGAISGTVTIKPGYYWLASDWDNLLFACPFCNQTNTHIFITDEEGSTEERVMGKIDKFPLANESLRLNHAHGGLFFDGVAAYKQAFAQEESVRLLLNPCIDDEVEQYFTYNEEGAIQVNAALPELERAKAEASIETYALHRLALTMVRKEKLIEIRAQIRRVEEAIANYNRYSDSSYEERIRFDTILEREMRILKQYKSPSAEYAGMARFIIDTYFEKAGFI